MLLPIRAARGIWRATRVLGATVLALLPVASRMLDVASVATGSVTRLLSTAYETVTGAASVTGKLRRKLVSREKTILLREQEIAKLRRPRTVTAGGKKILLNEFAEARTSRISRRMAKLASLNLGSTVAEAIPYLGVAAVMGVTVWDLKSSCETMKEMHELNLAFNPDAAADPQTEKLCGMPIPTGDEIWTAVKASPGKAWHRAMVWLPDLPEVHVPKIDWTPWN